MGASSSSSSRTPLRGSTASTRSSAASPREWTSSIRSWSCPATAATSPPRTRRSSPSPSPSIAIVGPMAATKSIELRTSIPGPRSREILKRKERVVADPLSIYLPIVAAEGRGATLTDVDGNTFIDFTGGVGCLNVGHTDFTIVPYELYVTLAERLCAVTPIAGPRKAAFFNAGTEAVENAIKFARAFTGRPAVIAFEGGFHGRTLLSL